jgi:nucleoside-diphosphate-sugar epimerase
MSGLRGRTALVTGASGFIGSAVARRLRDAGAAVHCASRGAEVEPGPWDRWWQVDLANAADVRRLLAASRPDIVCHLAGVTAAARGVEGVLPILHANLLPTVNLLVAAAEEPVARLLLAGSLEEPQPDGLWPVPSSPYAAAKYAAGAYMRMCHALYDSPAVWMRLFMVYGPAQRDVRKLVPYVATTLLAGETPALSDGRRAVDWVYVEDVADAFVAAAIAPGIEGRTLDIGSGHLVTVREIAERVAQVVGPAPSIHFGAVPERRLEQMRVADIARTAEAIGWRAATSMDDGLRATVEWYRRELAPPLSAPRLRLIGA